MNTLNQMVTNKQKGFTLIELVMVIVILGILAAFALPRFADLGGDARASTLAGAQGSVKSAAAIAHSAWLATDQATPVDLDGTNITMTDEGYPTADVAGIGTAAQLSTEDYVLTDGSATTVATISPVGASTAATCIFSYNPQTGQTSGFNDVGC